MWSTHSDFLNFNTYSFTRTSTPTPVLLSFGTFSSRSVKSSNFTLIRFITEKFYLLKISSRRAYILITYCFQSFVQTFPALPRAIPGPAPCLVWGNPLPFACCCWSCSTSTPALMLLRNIFTIKIFKCFKKWYCRSFWPQLTNFHSVLRPHSETETANFHIAAVGQ